MQEDQIQKDTPSAGDWQNTNEITGSCSPPVSELTDSERVGRCSRRPMLSSSETAGGHLSTLVMYQPVGLQVLCIYPMRAACPWYTDTASHKTPTSRVDSKG